MAREFYDISCMDEIQEVAVLTVCMYVHIYVCISEEMQTPISR